MKRLSLSLLLLIVLAQLAIPAYAAPMRDITHVVRRGETLYRIAVRYNVSMTAIVSANRLRNANYIFVGQRLIIPGVGSSVPASGITYTVKRGDSLYGIADRYGVSYSAIVAANGITNPNLIFVGQRLTIPGSSSGPSPTPTAGATSTPMPTNTPVPATATPVPGSYTANGIRGDAFWVENTTAGANQDVWFSFKVTNTTAGEVAFSVLSAHADNGPSAQSWTNAVLGPNQVLEWRDHINIATPGAYQLYLGICFGGKDACLANAAGWSRLSGSVAVTVQ